MAHGGGGKLMHRLLEELVVPTFGDAPAGQRHDAAVLSLGSGMPRVAMTTDSYVVRPLFFPGGDIGSLAVNGTVNDLAMAGARPVALTCGLILEEGLPVETLRRVLASMRACADAAGVSIVTGDTKVVDRGKGDGVYVNTAGIGVLEHDQVIAPGSVREGDVLLLSGDLGRHGIAIMAEREGLAFETTIESDCAPLAGPALDLLREGIEVHCMRDLTRGGLASALVEIAEASQLHLRLEESSIPVREDVQGACEILGFDPLYVANEGRFIAFVPESQSRKALEVMARHSVSAEACRVGAVVPGRPGFVTMTSSIGATRIVDMLSGEQLPRIC
jgi:hydrogenase expression/formation protein HypE